MKVNRVKTLEVMMLRPLFVEILASAFYNGNFMRIYNMYKAQTRSELLTTVLNNTRDLDDEEFAGRLVASAEIDWDTDIDIIVF